MLLSLLLSFLLLVFSDIFFLFLFLFLFLLSLSLSSVWKVTPDKGERKEHNFAVKTYVSSLPATKFFLSNSSNSLSNVSRSINKLIPFSVGLQCGTTYSVTFQKSNDEPKDESKNKSKNKFKDKSNTEKKKEKQKNMCVDGQFAWDAVGANIWGATVFQAECPCPQPTVHISSDLEKGDDNITRIGLRWDPASKKTNPKEHACYQEKKKGDDLVCVYNLKEMQDPPLGSSLLPGRVAPVYMDGFIQDFYSPSEIVLSKVPRYTETESQDQLAWHKYPRRYLVRYEPQDPGTKTPACRLPWIKGCIDEKTGLTILDPTNPTKCGVYWGQHVVEFDHKKLNTKSKASTCEMVGVPPVTTLVEISLNGQQFHSLGQYYTYYDRAYYTDHHTISGGRPCDVHDHRNVLSYSPETIPREGGTMLTLSGVPVDLSVWSQWSHQELDQQKRKNKGKKNDDGNNAEADSIHLPKRDRPDPAFGLGGSSLYPGSGPCEGGTHVVVMSANVSMFARVHGVIGDVSNKDRGIKFACRFGVVRVPAIRYATRRERWAPPMDDDEDNIEEDGKNGGGKSDMLNDDPDQDTVWCVAPRVMSCGRVPFALLASFIPTTMVLPEKEGKEVIENRSTTDDSLLEVEEVVGEGEARGNTNTNTTANNNNNNKTEHWFNLGLGDMVTYTYVDLAFEELGRKGGSSSAESSSDVLMSNNRGACSASIKIVVSGLNLNPSSHFGCRFGHRVVRADVERKDVTFNNIGSVPSDGGVSIVCYSPQCIYPGEVSFAVVAVPSQFFDGVARENWRATREESESRNINRAYSGAPKKPETDLTKDPLYFTWYDDEDGDRKCPCPPPLIPLVDGVGNTKMNGSPSWHERAYCVIGNKRSRASWDPGTLARTTESSSGHANRHGIKNHVEKNTKVGRRSPSLSCIVPPQEISLEEVPLYFLVDGVKYDQFTYQPNKNLVVYDPYTIESVDPPHGSCGTKLSMSLVTTTTSTTTGETAMTETTAAIHSTLATKTATVYVGESFAMACMYDTSSGSAKTDKGKDGRGKSSSEDDQSNRVRCLQSLPSTLKPGGLNLRVSHDLGQSVGEGGVRFISYDTPHASYTGPNRGGTTADGSSTKTSLFFLRFAPRSGPTEGGTHVIVTGRDFSGGHGYMCRFGGKEVPGIFRFASGRLAGLKKGQKAGSAAPRGVGGGGGGGGQHGVLLCIAPPSEKSGMVSFGISVNGHDFSCGSGGGGGGAGPPCGGFEYYVSHKGAKGSGEGDASVAKKKKWQKKQQRW